MTEKNQPAGADQPGAAQTGADQAGADQPGAVQPGAEQPTVEQPSPPPQPGAESAARSGAGAPPPAAPQPGAEQPTAAQTAAMQQPGPAQSGGEQQTSAHQAGPATAHQGPPPGWAPTKAPPGKFGRFVRHRATGLVAVGLAGVLVGGGVVGMIAAFSHDGPRDGRPGIAREFGDGPGRHRAGPPDSYFPREDRGPYRDERPGG
ncbi:hypothetical protein [Amycolatopsis sp. 195334CR]|uniref:hypothetical protein n=1 Tax=Amycolatopsis sp. 195334CR TaxID=2814588 RepID=UPI001A8FBF55|nr:hypothetical protein [Amycolatopsis sp. 195334CR]MBN6037167.1 hypothetical protein [Amycolatopsis sp. 195334CR]